jgi:hypothetical protein
MRNLKCAITVTTRLFAAMVACGLAAIATHGQTVIPRPYTSGTWSPSGNPFVIAGEGISLKGLRKGEAALTGSKFQAQSSLRPTPGRARYIQ